MVNFYTEEESKELIDNIKLKIWHLKIRAKQLESGNTCKDCSYCVNTLPENKGVWICKANMHFWTNTIRLSENSLDKINDCEDFEKKE